jgi:hypothetical protein
MKTPSGKPVTSAVPEYQQQGKNKHNNVICEADKIKFPSKKHRAHYLLLKAMQQNGEIRFFLREVPFDLIGHYENGRVVRHYLDFMLCLPDGTYRYQEVKGRDLAMGKLKRAQTEEIYGIRIEVI